ncbi:type III-A CRISPR-associated protein Csm2 [Thermodesulfovibrio hydrogeniphilus]
MDIKFWLDKEKELINPELFSSIAQQKAQEVANDNSGEDAPTQLRKFYDEVLRYDSMIKNDEDFQKLFPFIKMINAKVAYSKARKSMGKNYLISDKFKDFLTSSINSVKDKKDFKVFVNFFESFMGFYKYEYEKKQEEKKEEIK